MILSPPRLADSRWRVRLRNVVTLLGEDGSPDPNGQFERHGASDIYREDGKRMIAVKFSVGGYTDPEDGKFKQRDLSGAGLLREDGQPLLQAEPAARLLGRRRGREVARREGGSKDDSRRVYAHCLPIDDAQLATELARAMD